MTGGGPGVRFADGFDRPERIAFGLEAPQLACVVAASLLAWSVLRGSGAGALRDLLAAVIAATGAALGWGRWEERPLLTWAWLAARFAVLPRRGGGVPVVLAADAGAGGDATGGAGAGGAVREEAPVRRAGATVGGAAGRPAPWLRWVDAPAPEQPHAAGSPPPGTVPAGMLVVTGRFQPVPPDSGGPPRPPLVLIPAATTGAGPPGHPARVFARWLADEAAAEPARTVEAPLAPVIPLPSSPWNGGGGGTVLELDDRAEPAVAVDPATRPPGTSRGALARARRVAFFSLNGGSGRTTLACEVTCLCAADAVSPLRVALLDLDLRSAGVALRLGLPQPTRWDGLLNGGDRLERGDDVLTAHPSGARVLLGPPRAASGTPLEPARVAELLHLLDREGTDLVVIDVAPDLGAVATVVLGAVDTIHVVLTPSARGIQDAYRSTEALRRMGLGAKIAYVVNRDCGGAELDEAMGDLGGPVVSRVPLDPAVEAAENAHRAVGLTDDGPAAVALRRLAGVVASSGGGGGEPQGSPWG